MNDKNIGSLLIALSASFSFYYSVWVIGLPFFDSDHFIHSLFPPVHFALLVPALMGLVFIGSLIIFCIIELKKARVASKCK